MQLNKNKKYKATLETYGILEGIYCAIKVLQYYHVDRRLMLSKRILNSLYIRSIRGLQDLDRR